MLTWEKDTLALLAIVGLFAVPQFLSYLKGRKIDHQRNSDLLEKLADIPLNQNCKDTAKLREMHEVFGSDGNPRWWGREETDQAVRNIADTMKLSEINQGKQLEILRSQETSFLRMGDLLASMSSKTNESAIRMEVMVDSEKRIEGKIDRLATAKN